MLKNIIVILLLITSCNSNEEINKVNRQIEDTENELDKIEKALKKMKKLNLHQDTSIYYYNDDSLGLTEKKR